MKKSALIIASVIALSVSACGNLSKVTKDGTTDNPNFPNISQSGFNHDGTQLGSWVNWDNVSQIEKGMNKDQIRNLIGDPHFSEGLFGVREWDYAFNYRENGQHKVCQYKVLFDKDMNVNQQWWLPNGCGGLAPYQLSADTLFAFNKSNLTEQGQKTMQDLAMELKNADAKTLKVIGYTDRLGSDAYNLTLSKQRADTVKMALQQYGVNADIETEGRGKAEQVKACDGLSGKAEKDCLSPNRRVVIFAQGTKAVMDNTGKAGHNGPARVSEYQKDVNKTSWK